MPTVVTQLDADSARRHVAYRIRNTLRDQASPNLLLTDGALLAVEPTLADLLAREGIDVNARLVEPPTMRRRQLAGVACEAVALGEAPIDLAVLDLDPKAYVDLGHLVSLALTELKACRDIICLATGQTSAQALHDTVFAPTDRRAPVSLLRDHPRLTVVCDRAARHGQPGSA